jgi:muramidase (phage lysozyme)
MSQTMTSPSGKILRHHSTVTTTPKESAEAKAIRIELSKKTRLDENKEYLKDPNVKAFIETIAKAEGGGYDFKYGAIKGKKNDPWRFTDYSTHPGVGFGGSSTAAGMYQITIATWKEMGGKMGLTDFSSETQDLLAVEILRTIGVVDKIKARDIEGGLSKASARWAALPQGEGKSGRYDQPFIKYEDFVASYKSFGGSVK